MSKGSTRIINSKTSGANFSNSSSYDDDEHQLRRGPWTLEEDNLLIQYITCHGEGRWNSLAKCAGLKRTGKSCRLRWLNYLKPDIKRGNLTPPEQLLILELHSKWGNRWSRIAQHLPGRTDNEIKNYWRTRVQKQARQLKVDSNSEKFLEAIRTFWMPRLLEKMEQNKSSSSLKSITTLDTPNQVFLPSISTNTFDNNSTVEVSVSPSLTPQLSYGKKIPPPVEEDGSCYHVDNNIPSCYDDVVQDFESHDTCCVTGGLHVAELDWFGEDLGTGTFWNNTDELWQFRKPEELGHV